MSTTQIAASCWLTADAKKALLSAPTSAKGTKLSDTSAHAAVQELRYDGLIDSQLKLTDLGASKHAQLSEEATR